MRHFASRTPSARSLTTRGAWLLLVPFALSVALSGCVDDSVEVTPEDRSKLKAFILNEAPSTMQHKLKTKFAENFTLLGYTIKPEAPLKRGKRVKLTLYWQAHKELGDPGWKLFTHINDSSGERILNIDNVGPLRRMKGDNQVLAPSAWKAGKVYVDEQSFDVPKDLKTKSFQITTGIWKGSQRLKVSGGPTLKDDRAIVATISVSGKSSKNKPRRTRVPSLKVNKLPSGKVILIDGKLDEAEWKTAANTGRFIDVTTGQPNKKFPVNGSAKMLWDDKGFYIAFQVEDSDVTGGFPAKAKDPHLWTKDCIEIMIDPEGDGDNRDYFEIQINPQNLVFDTSYDSYNKPQKQPDGPFGHEEWSAQLKSAVVIDGTLDKPGDKDKGYVVETFVPWSSIKHKGPAAGKTWRMNLYAMQNNGGVAWSAILGQGNFHKASRFGRITWLAPSAPIRAVGKGGRIQQAVGAKKKALRLPNPIKIAKPIKEKK
ncbi:MAG: carbohydrate-binding family 9-like protein [Polyangiaceae bacterium]|nr:carbohydrate-binding family 9-like protein [Polyangiaceae bacterium]